MPVLAGLGVAQMTGVNPDRDRRVVRFLDAVRNLIAARRGRVVLVAGAVDFAHVGPSFGRSPSLRCHAAFVACAEGHGVSLGCAAEGDSAGFWAQVIRDLDERRVCGLAPIWSVLSCLPGPVRGKVLHYEQTVDSRDGSIVSHGAVLLTGRTPG